MDIPVLVVPNAFDDGRSGAACAKVGVTPRIAFEASTPLALADLAERGLGVAIVPASVARDRGSLHALKKIVPELRGRLVLVGGPAAR